VFDVLYTKAVGVHTREMYYHDGDDWVLFHTEILTVTWEWHTNWNRDKLVRVSSDTNGLLYEKTLDVDDGTYTVYTKPYSECLTVTEPIMGGETFNPDHYPQRPHVGVISWSDHEMLSVGEGTVSFVDWNEDADGISDRIFSTLTYSEPLDPTSVGAQVDEMLASVPLQVANQAAVNLYDGTGLDAEPLSGYIGFQSTQLATYRGNLINLFYVVTYGGDLELRMTATTVDTDDATCSDGENREQTFTPAAFTFHLPGQEGNGDGVLWEVGDTVNESGWMYLPYAQPSAINLETDVVTWAAGGPTTRAASAFGKKSLLARTEPEAWVIFVPYDHLTDTYLTDDTVCLDAGPVTSCLRYYYHTDADDGGTGSAENFTFDEAGIIYREIPVIVGPPGDCPAGTVAVNPCIP